MYGKLKPYPTGATDVGKSRNVQYITVHGPIR
jgi:hypothetical protein